MKLNIFVKSGTEISGLLIDFDHMSTPLMLFYEG